MIKFSKLIVYLGLFFSVLLSANGQTEEKNVKVSQTLHELQDDLNVIVNDPTFNNATIGVCVQSLKTGEYFYRHEENKVLLPASNVKLLTTSAALEYLGKDFTFTTGVYLDGTLKKGGEFVGNVIIRGAGDPTMSEYFYEEPQEIIEKWANALDSIGVRSIRGDIIGDDSYFDHQSWGVGWAWDDISYPFSAQVSALSFNDNIVELVVSSGNKVGDAAEVFVQPENVYLTINNHVKTVSAGGGTDLNAVRKGYSSVVDLTGTFAYDSSGVRKPISVSVTVDNPALFTVSLFKQALEKREIKIRGGMFDSEEWGDKINYAELRLACTHTSPPLSEVIKVINTMSHNLASEMLMKTLAKETSGIGSFEKGVEKLKQYSSQAGISPENIALVDGSGLSRLNLLSAKQFVTLLGYVHRSEYRGIFYESLAIPGEKGTLSARMKNTRAEHSVHAKTGSMNNTCSLSGYVTTRDDEALAFSIILNNFTVPQSLARNLQDLLCMRLASFSRK